MHGRVSAMCMKEVASNSDQTTRVDRLLQTFAISPPEVVFVISFKDVMQTSKTPGAIKKANSKTEVSTTAAARPTRARKWRGRCTSTSLTSKFVIYAFSGERPRRAGLLAA